MTLKEAGMNFSFGSTPAFILSDCNGSTAAGNDTKCIG